MSKECKPFEEPMPENYATWEAALRHSLNKYNIMAAWTVETIPEWFVEGWIKPFGLGYLFSSYCACCKRKKATARYCPLADDGDFYLCNGGENCCNGAWEIMKISLFSKDYPTFLSAARACRDYIQAALDKLLAEKEKYNG